MVEKLRERSAAFGLIGANGGHMSRYAVDIYSTRTQAVVVGRLDGTGERFLANTHDEDDRTLQAMMEEDSLGAAIHVRSYEYGNRFVFARPGR
ncbi:MAG: hypothetical protein ACREXP_22045 [Steroidobacteraceae bacterium]